MSKIQCLNCGGMAEVGNALSGECPYCGCRVEYRRASSFNGVEKSDLGQLRSLFESAGAKSAGEGKAPQEKNELAIALCYLLAGNFALAKKKLAALIENSPDSAEPYYYYSLTLIGGRALSAITMREAKAITGYLQTAMMLDGNFVFPKLLYALLCIEYYEGNDLLSPADGRQMLAELYETEVDQKELELFKSLVATKSV